MLRPGSKALADPGGICVSARVQEDAAGRLDLTFDDMGDQSLKNIARPVRVYRVRLAAIESRPSTTPAESGPVLALPDKPSIAVLPFQNMRGDPEQEYFADGMVEEIITALSRIRWLFVIARNSSFSYKGQSPDVKQVGRDLGVRYVLEGSVRKGGNRVRITAQLIDAITGTHLWADRFDGPMEDVFELQDKIAISVAGVIEPALQAAETARSANRPTNDLTAYDLYLRAYAMVLSSARQARGAPSSGAGDRARSALRAGTRLGRVLLTASNVRMAAANIRRMTPTRLLIWPGGPCKRRGTTPAHWRMPPWRSRYFGEDIGAMMALVDRALALNPSFARGWHVSGVLRLRAGQPDAAIEHVEASLRLSPRARSGWPSQVIGSAHFLSGRFDQAVPKLLLAIQDDPSFPEAYRLLAACYAHMGRLDEAREVVERLRAITAVMLRRRLSTKPRAPRALPVGPAPRCGRDDMTATRRLAAILAADVAGYSRLIGADEEGTLNRLRSIRAELIDPKITEHRGRIVKTTGDGLLVEFASVVDALRCATEWQARHGRAECRRIRRPHRVPHRDQRRRCRGRGRRYLR